MPCKGDKFKAFPAFIYAVRRMEFYCNSLQARGFCKSDKILFLSAALSKAPNILLLVSLNKEMYTFKLSLLVN